MFTPGPYKLGRIGFPGRPRERYPAFWHRRMVSIHLCQGQSLMYCLYTTAV